MFVRGAICGTVVELKSSFFSHRASPLSLCHVTVVFWPYKSKMAGEKKSGKMAKPTKVLGRAGRATRGVAAKRLVEEENVGTPPRSDKKVKMPVITPKKAATKVKTPSLSLSPAPGRGRAGRPKSKELPTKAQSTQASPSPVKVVSTKKASLKKQSTTANRSKLEVKRKLEQDYNPVTDEEEMASNVSELNMTADKIRLLVQEELENSHLEDSNRPDKIGVDNDFIQSDSDDSIERGDQSDGRGDESEDDEVPDPNLSLGTMVLDEEEYDETTPVKDLFRGDKEEELCRLWEEEKSLYLSTEPGYRDPNHRRDVIRRMALLLQIRRKWYYI